MAGSPSAAAVGGHGARCTDPSCHQLQTSSVTNGSTGANNRCTTDSASRSVARADADAGVDP